MKEHMQEMSAFLNEKVAGNPNKDKDGSGLCGRSNYSSPRVLIRLLALLWNDKYLGRPSKERASQRSWFA